MSRRPIYITAQAEPDVHSRRRSWGKYSTSLPHQMVIVPRRQRFSGKSTASESNAAEISKELDDILAACQELNKVIAKHDKEIALISAASKPILAETDRLRKEMRESLCRLGVGI